MAIRPGSLSLKALAHLYAQAEQIAQETPLLLSSPFLGTAAERAIHQYDQAIVLQPRIQIMDRVGVTPIQPICQPEERSQHGYDLPVVWFQGSKALV
jgi:hypothetical protein